MPKLSAIAALLVAVFVLIAGNSLVNTLIATRAKIEHFPQLSLGVLGSSYFVGMLVGTLAASAIVRHAGYVRAFTASVALAVIIALAYPLYVDPLAWIVLRGLLGFAFAVLYGVIETWINSKADNKNRGSVYGVYQLVHFGGGTLGQQMISAAAPTSFALFSISAMMTALAILPMALTKSEPPANPRSVRVRIPWLVGVSPVGTMAALCIGAANGAFWFLGPVFALGPDNSTERVATLMTAVIIGSAVGVWPIGRLSDFFDRRVVIVVCATCGAALEAVFFMLGMPGPLAMTLLGFCLGVANMSLYTLAAAQTNDRAGPDHATTVASGLLLLYCIGAIVAPYTGAWLMGRFGDPSLFALCGGVHAFLALFTLWRILRRAPVTTQVERDEKTMKPGTGFP